MDGENHPTKRALTETRERVLAQLTESFANNEISLEAFEKRVAEAYQAPSATVLEALVTDLAAPTTSALVPIEKAPLVAAVVTHPLTRARPTTFARAIFGSTERSGSFQLPEVARAQAIMGSLELDLREVVLGPGVTELHLRSTFGSIEVVVPADIAIECHGTGIFGSVEGRSQAPADRDPTTPTLRIFATAVFGSIEIRTRPPASLERRVRALRALKQHT